MVPLILPMALVAALTPALAFAEDVAQVKLVKSILAQINPISIRENVEYCGYIGIDYDGELMATGPTLGEEASCYADEPYELAVITASWHTHGGHSVDYYNEVPSIDDYEADEDEGIDGYVATPGGRLWYIDTTDGVMSQLCGIGCLPMDPGFRRGDNGKIAESYTYDELVVKLDE